MLISKLFDRRICIGNCTTGKSRSPGGDLPKPCTTPRLFATDPACRSGSYSPLPHSATPILTLNNLCRGIVEAKSHGADLTYLLNSSQGSPEEPPRVMSLFEVIRAIKFAEQDGKLLLIQYSLAAQPSSDSLYSFLQTASTASSPTSQTSQLPQSQPSRSA